MVSVFFKYLARAMWILKFESDGNGVLDIKLSILTVNCSLACHLFQK